MAYTVIDRHPYNVEIAVGMQYREGEGNSTYTFGSAAPISGWSTIKLRVPIALGLDFFAARKVAGAPGGTYSSSASCSRRRAAPRRGGIFNVQKSCKMPSEMYETNMDVGKESKIEHGEIVSLWATSDSIYLVWGLQ
jgi:hypothetical protein